MGYPGDQQQPGGRPPRRPPFSPFGSADDEAGRDDPAPFGSGRDEFAYGGPADAPPYDGGPPGAPFGDPRSRDPYGAGPQAGGPPGGFADPYPPDTPFGGRPGGGGHAPHPGGFEQAPYEPGPYEPGLYEQGPYEPGPYEQGPYEPGPYEPGYGHDPYGGGHPDDDEFDSGAGRRRLIIGAAIAVGVLVVGGTALALTSGGGSPSAAPSPSAPVPQKTATPAPTATETGKGDRLRSRETDPTPLTLNEVFRTKKFKGDGRTYLMTARRADRKCANGAHGASFRKMLAKGRCDQVLRATFTNGKFVGTVGVLNLHSQAAAVICERASHPKDAFIVPLPGSGVTSKVGQGLSLTTAEADGHYLILSWVQYPNGKKISKSDYGAVTAFVRNTTLGSNLRPALNYRSMEGKPS
jgi:hypothetical protein